MKSLLGLVLVGLAAVFLLNGCNTNSGPKVGVVDLRRTLTESQEGKKANAELESLVKEKKAEAARKAEEIAKLKKDLEKEPASTRKGKEEELARAGAEYQKLVSASDNQIQTRAADLRAGLLKEIKIILDSMGAEEKYTLIVSAESAAYFEKSIDITDKVITKYNEMQGTK